MKKIILILFVFLLTGCSFYTDIGEITILDSIYILKDNNLVIYFKFKDEDNSIYKEECNNIEICFNRLSNKLSKKLFLSQMNLLVFQDNLNIDDYKSIIYFFINEKSSRNYFNTVMVNNINEDLLNTSSEDINDITMLSSSNTGIVTNLAFNKMISDILNMGTSYIPYFYIDKDIDIIGYKKMFKDEKILTKEESISLNLITKRIENFSLEIDNNVYRFSNCKSKIKFKKDILNIDINCNSLKNIDELYVKNMIINYIENTDKDLLKYLNYKYKNNYEYPKYYVYVTLNNDIEEGGNIFE